MSSPGMQLMSFTTKVTGIAITSNPLGASVAATVGTFFVPSLAAGASKAAVVGAVFAGSWAFAWLATPVIVGLLGFSLLLSPEQGAKYRTLALLLGFANLIICAGIAAAALSASGVAISFSGVVLSVLAGTSVMMLGAALASGAVATALATCVGDAFNNGSGSEFSRGLWGNSR